MIMNLASNRNHTNADLREPALRNSGAAGSWLTLSFDVD